MRQLRLMAAVAIIGLAAWTAAAAGENAGIVKGDEGGAAASGTVIVQAEPADAAPAAPGQAQVTMTIQAAGETGQTPELGVALSAAGADLGKQLKLAPGTGLVVDAVSADGPAARAGVRRNDVLVRLDDQILVNLPQLAALLRQRRAGDKVSLTLVRGGEPLTVTPILAAGGQAAAVAFGNAVGIAGGGGGGGGAGGAQNQGTIRIGPMVLMQDQGAMTASSSFSDGEHSLHLTTRGNHKVLVAQDSDGNVVFSGPVNTDEQRKAVPPEVLRKLEDMEKPMGQMGMRVGMPMGLPMGFPAFLAARAGHPAPKKEPGPKALGTKIVVAMAEDGLTLTLTADDEHHALVAKDKAGDVVFEGPVETEDQRAKLPENIRGKLERLAASCGTVFFGK